MAETPRKMVFGLALGLIGGIIAMIGVAQAWNGLDSMPMVGLNLLVACMFFAAGGAFSTTTPVKGSTVLVLAAANEACVLISMMYGAADIVLNLVLAVIGVVIILFAACPHVEKWVDANRI